MKAKENKGALDPEAAEAEKEREQAVAQLALWQEKLRRPRKRALADRARIDQLEHELAAQRLPLPLPPPLSEAPVVRPEPSVTEPEAVLPTW